MTDENIFATEDENLTADEEFGDFELPTLALADVEDPTEAPRYETIPLRTRLNFKVYSAEFIRSSKKGTPGWELVLVLADEADQDKYGPKKKIFKTVYITEGTMQPFVKPLIKALDIEYDGQLTKEFVVRDFPEAALDRTLSFQVIGYKWKNAETGQWEQSFGKKDRQGERLPVPSQTQLLEWGSYLNEVVENAKPAEVKADGEGTLDGLGEFDASQFV